MDEMILYIRNDREQVIATIIISDGVVDEDRSEGFQIADIDSRSYKIDLLSNPETVENFSNETLLTEISNRMCQ